MPPVTPTLPCQGYLRELGIICAPPQLKQKNNNTAGIKILLFIKESFLISAFVPRTVILSVKFIIGRCSQDSYRPGNPRLTPGQSGVAFEYLVSFYIVGPEA